MRLIAAAVFVFYLLFTTTRDSVRVMVDQKTHQVTVDCLTKGELAYWEYPGTDQRKIQARIIVQCANANEANCSRSDASSSRSI